MLHQLLLALLPAPGWRELLAPHTGNAGLQLLQRRLARTDQFCSRPPCRNFCLKSLQSCAELFLQLLCRRRLCGGQFCLERGYLEQAGV